MRRSHALLTCLCAALILPACAGPYRSFYRETNHQLHPAPIPAEQVKVVKSADDLTSEWTEVGIYRGHAPTVNEAMQAAQGSCGKAGAELFILNTPPFEAGGLWKLDGFCAARGSGT
ncbi:MAG: hypothetical protein H6712_16430 [Myxococcales bacterium]|nr:hypothetical protein [Myxococcales bacterium]MCB9715457.1 hypothetical protein [Myxococcales bacterium]